MSSVEQLDSFMIKSSVPYETIGNRTWVMHPETSRGAQIAIKVEEPIVLFSVRLFALRENPSSHESLFRRLLELNSELMHSAYSLQGDQVVLSGAYQLDHLDYNEFQAMIDDMCMALDNHYEKLAPWVPSSSQGKDAGNGRGDA